MQKPTIGRIVHYRGRLGVQALQPAMVVTTVDTLEPEGVAAHPELALTSDMHVHLRVLTASDEGGYTEYNVPHGRGDDAGDDIPPGSWAWPTIPPKEK